MDNECMKCGAEWCQCESDTYGIQYWIDVSECVCDSPLPIGACLHCDMKRIKEAMNNLTEEQNGRKRKAPVTWRELE